MDTPTPTPEVQTPPAVAPTPVQPTVERKHSYGGLIGILLIVAIIIFGAFYVWGERIASREDPFPSSSQS